MKKLITAAAAAAIALIGTQLPALAAGTVYKTSLMTDEAHKTTVFDKYLVLEKEANVPNAAFTFSIEAGTAAAATDTTLAVLAGIGTPKLNADTDGDAEIAFAPADTATDEASKATGDTPVFATADTSDEKYVKKTLTLDFSGIAFPEPGIYRYILEETGDNPGVINGYQGEENDPVTKRTLDVYVEDYENFYSGLTEAQKADYTAPDGHQLLITGYVFYEGDAAGAPKKTDDADTAKPDESVKSSGITNLYETQDLTFSKTVTGNQGSKDKYFKFTVTIENAVAGTVYDVDLSNADAAPAKNAATVYDPMTNPAKITVPADATAVTQDFYLQHGQSVTILGLAKGTKYTVTETPEDYTASAAVTGGDVKTGDGIASEADITLSSNAMQDDYMQDDATVAYTNNREGVIPTGILLSTAAPMLFCSAMAGVLTVLVIRRVKKKDQ